MKLHWRTYWHESTEWWLIPWIGYRRFTESFYPRELSFDWLKWGFSIRWWWR